MHYRLTGSSHLQIALAAVKYVHVFVEHLASRGLSFLAGIRWQCPTLQLRCQPCQIRLGPVSTCTKLR